MSVASAPREASLKDKDYALRSNERNRDDFQKNADDILLSQYTPPSVIVNDQLDIVQFRGSTGAYLEPSPGKASLNVLKMARNGLTFELRNALHKAKVTTQPFSREGIPLEKGKRFVSIEVIPLLNTVDLHFLILFKEFQQTPALKELSEKDKKKISGKIIDAKDAQILQLEKDLSQGREDMLAITEDQEAANEELLSANEELLAAAKNCKA